MAQRLGPRTSAVEIYQQIAGIFNSLEQTGDEYQAFYHLQALAVEASSVGIVLSVPTTAELQERHRQSKILEEAYYEESYETSQVC